MAQRVTRPILSGAFCIAFGGAVVWGALGYRFGTVRAMGPGFAPAVLGGMLVAIGAGLLLTGLRDRTPVPSINLRPLLLIVGALAAFGLTIGRFGLVPAVFLTVMIAGLAEREANRLMHLLLAVGMLALVYVIFIYFLGLPIPMLRWRP
jgi:hypothetical protein